MDIASTISRFLENDIDRYRALNSIEDYSLENYDEEYYQEMTEVLQNIKSRTGALFIYTMKYGTTEDFIYVLDAEDPSSENYSPLGTTEPVWAELTTTFESGLESFTDFGYDPTWEADLVIGLSPIIDPDSGEVIGVVGVDYDYAYVQPLIDRIGTVILLGGLMFGLVLAIIIFHLFETRLEALETDYLTNLFSKRYFDRHLQISLTDARYRNQPLSMMMIDVDSFKAINDQYGHLAGDKILRETANILKSSIRRADICARYGGDEFSVILPDANSAQAKAVGERILENILHYQESPERTDSIPLTLSIGIAEWKAETTCEGLINQADTAMYSSKNTGKNKITFFEE